MPRSNKENDFYLFLSPEGTNYLSVDEKSALKIKECLTSSTKLHESSKLLRNIYQIYSRGFFEKGYLNEKKKPQTNKTKPKLNTTMYMENVGVFCGS